MARPGVNYVYWFFFIVGIFSLSAFFNGDDYIAAGETAKAWLMIPATLGVFLVSMVAMAYIIYAEEKEKNNLKTFFAPFELIYGWMHKEGQN